MLYTVVNSHRVLICSALVPETRIPRGYPVFKEPQVSSEQVQILIELIIGNYNKITDNNVPGHNLGLTGKVWGNDAVVMSLGGAVLTVYNLEKVLGDASEASTL